MLREYKIEDCGEDFQVALILDGKQIGSVIFYDDGTGSAFDLAHEMAEAWVNFRVPPTRRSLFTEIHFG